MNQHQTPIIIVQNENEQVEEQVIPITSKRVYMKFNRLFAQKFDQNPTQ